MDERVPAVLVLQYQLADLIKVPHHELATDTAGGGLNLHPLPSGIALGKTRETMNGRTTMRKIRLDVCVRRYICMFT